MWRAQVAAKQPLKAKFQQAEADDWDTDPDFIVCFFLFLFSYEHSDTFDFFFSYLLGILFNDSRENSELVAVDQIDALVHGFAFFEFI